MIQHLHYCGAALHNPQPFRRYISHLTWTGVHALSTQRSVLSTQNILNTKQTLSFHETRHLAITTSSHPISSMSYTFDRIAPGSLVLVTGERRYYKPTPPSRECCSPYSTDSCKQVPPVSSDREPLDRVFDLVDCARALTDFIKIRHHLRTRTWLQSPSCHAVGQEAAAVPAIPGRQIRQGRHRVC